MEEGEEGVEVVEEEGVVLAKEEEWTSKNSRHLSMVVEVAGVEEGEEGMEKVEEEVAILARVGEASDRGVLGGQTTQVEEEEWWRMVELLLRRLFLPCPGRSVNNILLKIAFVAKTLPTQTKKGFRWIAPYPKFDEF